jgi:hypothetical protein
VLDFSDSVAYKEGRALNGVAGRRFRRFRADDKKEGSDMKSIRSFADVVRDWEELLEAVNDNAEVLASAEPQRAAMEASLAALRAKRAHQASCAASRQQATQDLAALIDQGNENARRLRGVVKAVLGTKSERLVQFRVTPLRSRRRSKATEPAPSDQAVKGSGQ